MPRYATADPPLESRRRFRRDTRSGGGTQGAWTLARVIDLLVTIVVGIIVAGILLVLLEANPGNAIVEPIVDAARWLAGPFRDIFSIENAKTEVAVNWGVAALVYLLVGRLITSTMRRMASPAPVD